MPFWGSTPGGSGGGSGLTQEQVQQLIDAAIANIPTEGGGEDPAPDLGEIYLDVSEPVGYYSISWQYVSDRLYDGYHHFWLTETENGTYQVHNDIVAEDVADQNIWVALYAVKSDTEGMISATPNWVDVSAVPQQTIAQLHNGVDEPLVGDISGFFPESLVRVGGGQVSSLALGVFAMDQSTMLGTEVELSLSFESVTPPDTSHLPEIAPGDTLGRRVLTLDQGQVEWEPQPIDQGIFQSSDGITASFRTLTLGQAQFNSERLTTSNRGSALIATGPYNFEWYQPGEIGFHPVFHDFTTTISTTSRNLISSSTNQDETALYWSGDTYLSTTNSRYYQGIFNRAEFYVPALEGSTNWSVTVTFSYSGFSPDRLDGGTNSRTYTRTYNKTSSGDENIEFDFVLPFEVGGYALNAFGTAYSATPNVQITAENLPDVPETKLYGTLTGRV